MEYSSSDVTSGSTISRVGGAGRTLLLEKRPCPGTLIYDGELEMEKEDALVRNFRNVWK
jgi:hypothetical protein